MTTPFGIPEEMIVRSRPVRLPGHSEATNDEMDFVLRAAPIGGYEREYLYVKGRKLRADFAWPAQQLLVEVVGGIYTGQAHGSVSGILKDIERLNEATLNGWRLLRVTPEMVTNGEALELVERALTQ